MRAAVRPPYAHPRPSSANLFASISRPGLVNLNHSAAVVADEAEGEDDAFCEARGILEDLIGMIGIVAVDLRSNTPTPGDDVGRGCGWGFFVERGMFPHIQSEVAFEAFPEKISRTHPARLRSGLDGVVGSAPARFVCSISPETRFEKFR